MRLNLLWSDLRIPIERQYCIQLIQLVFCLEYLKNLTRCRSMRIALKHSYNIKPVYSNFDSGLVYKQIKGQFCVCTVLHSIYSVKATTSKAIDPPSFFFNSKFLQFSKLEDFPGSQINVLSFIMLGQKRSSIISSVIEAETSTSQ